MQGQQCLPLTRSHAFAHIRTPPDFSTDDSTRVLKQIFSTGPPSQVCRCLSLLWGLRASKDSNSPSCAIAVSALLSLFPQLRVNRSVCVGAR